MRIENYHDNALDNSVASLFDTTDAKLALDIDGWSVWIDARLNQMIIKRFDDVLVLSDVD